MYSTNNATHVKYRSSKQKTHNVCMKYGICNCLVSWSKSNKVWVEFEGLIVLFWRSIFVQLQEVNYCARVIPYPTFRVESNVCPLAFFLERHQSLWRVFLTCYCECGPSRASHSPPNLLLLVFPIQAAITAEKIVHVAQRVDFFF